MLKGATAINAIVTAIVLLLPSKYPVHVFASATTTTSTTTTTGPSDVGMAFVPKFDNLIPFDQALSGAHAARKELGHETTVLLEYIAPPSAEGSAEAQIDIVRRVTQTGFTTLLLSNNAGDDISPACRSAQEAGLNVVTWDSPIPSGVGESIFVAQVDFGELGKVMADMALDILSSSAEGKGNSSQKFAVLSASKRAANQNKWIEAMMRAMESDPGRYGSLELVEIAFGDDDDATSYNEAMRLMNDYEDIGLIMSPTTIGIAAAARAATDEGKCGTIKVSGLGVPGEMLSYTNSGCVPVFALWSFVDLGYLTYYTAYALETGQLTIEPGSTFQAGRLGEFTVERDPTRPNVEAYRVLMGDFTLYDRSNIEKAVFFDAVQGDGGQKSFEERYMDKYKSKALAIVPKVTGMISFIASGYVVWHILHHQRRRALTKNRILVGISIHDMISAFFGFFLSTWPVPAETWLVYGASGTTRSCTMQGFFFHAGISASPLYHASLSSVYVLNIVFELSNDRIARRAEPLLHAFPILFAWGTAIAGLPLKLYNPADRIGFFCYIAEYPTYCSLRDSCERGENARVYLWAFLLVWIFIVFVYMAICMLLIYHKVLSVERARDKWLDGAGLQRHRSKSSLVRRQGVRYCIAFFFPWVFGISAIVLKNQTFVDLASASQYDDAVTALSLTNAIIWPLKGLFTFIAYVRPSRKRVHKKAGHTHTHGTRDSNGEVTEEREGYSNAKSKLPASVKHYLTRSSLRRAQKTGQSASSNGSASSGIQETTPAHSPALAAATCISGNQMEVIAETDGEEEEGTTCIESKDVCKEEEEKIEE